ncbi:condensation domain-containing protein, partial [Streptomyces sp. NPDC006516]|uniref:condensation domain-containing protein n=1 Tax=Streptomyces sp. NPDC006516 TaxID=3154309 RepID=UPI0033A3C273
RPVGVHDDFFALGGDSILSLQVVFRAKQCGLFFSVKQLFEVPTVAGLAGVVERRDVSGVVAEQGVVVGPVELSPVQRWFFGQGFSVVGHVNQSVLVEVDAGLSVGVWERVVRCLLVQHDGLRARFVCEGGVWRAELGGVPDVVPCEVVDVSSCGVGGREAFVVEVAGRVQGGLSLGGGDVFRVVVFTGWGGGLPDRVLLVAHHLVVDVVSWRIVLEDLRALVGRVGSGLDPVLPAKSSAWRDWTARLGVEARGGVTSGEVGYWLGQVEPVGGVPLDRVGAGTVGGNTVGGSRVCGVVLGVEETRALLRDVPAVFDTRVNDVLLAGVAAAVGAWSGVDRVRVDVEGHGREELFDDLDVSRTVGWFTTISPVMLPVPSVGGVGEGLKA